MDDASILKRHVASERNEVPQRQDFRRLRWRSTEAMKHRTQLASVGPHLPYEFIVAVPRMKDHVEAKLISFTVNVPCLEAASGHPDAEGRDLIFGVRPEDVQIASGAPLAARVSDVENHGVEQIVTLMAGSHRLRATVPVTQKLLINDVIAMGWAADRVLVFDAQSGKNLRHGG